LHLTPISKEPAWFSTQVSRRIIEGDSKRTALHIRIQNVMLAILSGGATQEPHFWRELEGKK